MREYVTRAELLDLLNEELAREDDHAGCVIAGPIWHLQEPDEAGCNWSDSLVIQAGEDDPRACTAAVARAATRVRSKYNLRSDEGWLDDIVFQAEGHLFVGFNEMHRNDEQAWWCVRVDGGPQQRAFLANPHDTQPEVIRDRILTWWRVVATG